MRCNQVHSQPLDHLQFDLPIHVLIPTVVPCIAQGQLQLQLSMAGVAAWLDLIAFTSTFLFCGAALYISLVEHPARMQLPTHEAVQWFRKSYPRAAVLQPTHLRIGLVASALRYFKATPPVVLHTESLQRAHLVNLVISLTIAVWTAKLMVPGNKALMGAQQLSDSQSNKLLQTWGMKHAVRTLLSGVAMLALLIAQMGLV